jgi:hypothetical protein
MNHTLIQMITYKTLKKNHNVQFYFINEVKYSLNFFSFVKVNEI